MEQPHVEFGTKYEISISQTRPESFSLVLSPLLFVLYVEHSYCKNL